MDKKVSFNITGMSCAACAARIEKGLKKVEGVKQANINFAVEKATVEFDDSVVGQDKIGETVKKLGYGILQDVSHTVNEKNNVDLKITGMSCAACAAKIEKKLGRMEGIDNAAVNLTTEKAVIEYDPSKIKTSEIIKTIGALGYKADKVEEMSRDREKEQRDKEIKKLRFELIAAALLSSPLIMAMILTLINIDIAFLHNEYFQLIVATPVPFIIRFRFYTNAYHALK